MDLQATASIAGQPASAAAPGAEAARAELVPVSSAAQPAAVPGAAATAAVAPQAAQTDSLQPTVQNVARSPELCQRPNAAEQPAASPAIEVPGTAAGAFSASAGAPQAVQAASPVQHTAAPSWEDSGLTVLAVGIIAAIAALLIKKVLVGFGGYTAASQSSFM